MIQNLLEYHTFTVQEEKELYGVLDQCWIQAPHFILLLKILVFCMLGTSILHVDFTNLLRSVVWTVGTDAFEDLSQDFDSTAELIHILILEALFQQQEIAWKLRVHPLKNYIYNMPFKEWRIDEQTILVVILSVRIKIVNL